MTKHTTIAICSLAAILTGTAHAQLKIGTNPATLGTSSLVELESTNKGLLLTRVTDTLHTTITNPVNGMVVYDISRQCITAFQNGAWSSCVGIATPVANNVATSSNGMGGALDWATTLTFTDLAILGGHTSGNAGATLGVSSGGNVYAWGYNRDNFLAGMQSGILPYPAIPERPMTSPVWQKSSLFNGIAYKVAVGLNSNAGNYCGTYAVLTTPASGGKLYMWGYAGGGNIPGYVGIPSTINGLNNVLNQPVLVPMPPGATSIVDVKMSEISTNTFCLDNNGKAWWSGTNFGTVSALTAVPFYNSWQQIALPTGVAAYTKIWCADCYAPTLFMLGSDNNLYVTGRNSMGMFGSGVEGSIATAPNYTAYTPSTAAGIFKVALPLGTVVTKVIGGTGFGPLSIPVMALTNTGQLYVWGQDGTPGNPSYNTAIAPVTSTVFTSYKVLPTPVPVTLPAGETSITDFALGGGSALFLIGGSGQCYTSGQNGGSYYTDGSIRRMLNYAPASEWLSYRKVDAVAGLSLNRVLFHNGTSFWWNTANGVVYTFGTNQYSNSGSGWGGANTTCPAYQGYGAIFPARPLLSGFVDETWGPAGTNSVNTGSNPYPGPGN